MTATQHLRFWLIGLVVAGGLVWLLSDVLFPFVAGMAIAYLLDPLADRLEAIKAPRWLATTLVLSGFFLIFVTLLVVIAPLIRVQIVGLVGVLPEYAAAVEQALIPVFEAMRARISDAEFEQLRASAGQYVGSAVSWIGSLIGGIWRGGVAVLDLVSLMVITPVVAFYLLRDWDRLTAKVDTLMPRPYAATIRGLMGEVNESLASFIRGQGMVCTILGVFYAIALTLVGLNFGLLVGLGAGLVSFIPYVGSIAGFVVATGIAIFQFDDWTMWVVVAGVFMVGQAIEGNFLTPKLVGESIGLHPVWVMFALLAGGSLFGFTGLMLAVPVAAVVGVMVRFFIGRYQGSHYFLGAVPASGPEPDPDPAPAHRTRRGRRRGCQGMTSLGQLTFDLGHRSAMGLADFLVAESNQAAVDWLDRWPGWPGSALAIHGPAGCGKTHLTRVWAARSDAVLLDAGTLADRDLSSLPTDRPAVAVDDADKIIGAAAEEALLHLYNLVREGQGHLLLTGLAAPARWPLSLPDLTSRLKTIPVVAVADPDDPLLAAVLVKLFADRQLSVASEVISYLPPRMERSLAAARDLVAAIDAASLAQRRPVTVPLVRAVLERGGSR